MTPLDAGQEAEHPMLIQKHESRVIQQRKWLVYQLMTEHVDQELRVEKRT